MVGSMLRIYHSLPPALRSVAVSLYGYRLRHDRYSSSTQRLVEQARDRERWSPEEWDRWRSERLAYVLHRAATRIPYYRDQWAERRRRGDNTPWDALENWPLLEKEPARRNPEAFVADDCDVRSMILDTTSGTTFTPLSVWWSRETARAWYALMEARCPAWYGMSRNDRWAHLGARWVTPVQQRTPPFWVWNAAFKQLYMSSYHLAPDLVPHYLNAIRRYRIKYLWGYPSSLYPLAQGILSLGRRDLKVAVAITDGEQLFDYQRQAIEEAFQCPVCETYGMSELVAAASECRSGTFHLWPEVGLIEVLEDGKPVPAGQTGELICTGLLNADMPLIRYRVGDRGVPSESKGVCPCGRTLPALMMLAGRADDVLYTNDGRAVGRLCTVIQGNIAVYEAQIIQEQLGLVRIRYVPTPDYSPASAQAIEDRLRACMGDVKVVFEEVDQIPRGPNGKFRTVVSRLSEDELKACATGPAAIETNPHGG